MEQFIAPLPYVTIMISVMLLLKKPRRTSNFSMSMTLALVAFCLLAWVGTDSALSENSLFISGMAILCLYCITAVPTIMHLTSVIRQRKKMALKELAEKENEQN